jgi:hypothetical protein
MVSPFSPCYDKKEGKVYTYHKPLRDFFQSFLFLRRAVLFFSFFIPFLFPFPSYGEERIREFLVVPVELPSHPPPSDLSPYYPYIHRYFLLQSQGKVKLYFYEVSPIPLPSFPFSDPSQREGIVPLLLALKNRLPSPPPDGIVVIFPPGTLGGGGFFLSSSVVQGYLSTFSVPIIAVDEWVAIPHEIGHFLGLKDLSMPSLNLFTLMGGVEEPVPPLDPISRTLLSWVNPVSRGEKDLPFFVELDSGKVLRYQGKEGVYWIGFAPFLPFYGEEEYWLEGIRVSHRHPFERFYGVLLGKRESYEGKWEIVEGERKVVLHFQFTPDPPKLTVQGTSSPSEKYGCTIGESSFRGAFLLWWWVLFSAYLFFRRNDLLNKNF